jgi:hypothetical protein
MDCSPPILGIRTGCGPHHPEIVVRELVPALHFHCVPGKLGFAPERQVPLVSLPCVPGAVRALDALRTRPLRRRSAS